MKILPFDRQQAPPVQITHRVEPDVAVTVAEVLQLLSRSWKKRSVRLPFTVHALARLRALGGAIAMAAAISLLTWNGAQLVSALDILDGVVDGCVSWFAVVDGSA